MDTASLLMLVGISMFTAALSALAFMLGRLAGERRAARDYVDRLQAMNQVERMRRAAHSAPVHLEEHQRPARMPDSGRRTVRVDDQPTVPIRLPDHMNKRHHRRYDG